MAAAAFSRLSELIERDDRVARQAQDGGRPQPCAPEDACASKFLCYSCVIK